MTRARTGRGDAGFVSAWTVAIAVACWAMVGLVVDGGRALRERSSAFGAAAAAAAPVCRRSTNGRRCWACCGSTRPRRRSDRRSLPRRQWLSGQRDRRRARRDRVHRGRHRDDDPGRARHGPVRRRRRRGQSRETARYEPPRPCHRRPRARGRARRLLAALGALLVLGAAWSGCPWRCCASARGRSGRADGRPDPRHPLDGRDRRRGHRHRDRPAVGGMGAVRRERARRARRAGARPAARRGPPRGLVDRRPDPGGGPLPGRIPPRERRSPGRGRDRTPRGGTLAGPASVEHAGSWSPDASGTGLGPVLDLEEASWEAPPARWRRRRAPPR